jgi:hypothetical protein
MSDTVKAILLGRVLPVSIETALLEVAGLTMNPELIEDANVQIALVEDEAGRQLGQVWIFRESTSQYDHADVYDGERTLLHMNPRLEGAARALVGEFGGYLQGLKEEEFVFTEGRRTVSLSPADALLRRLQATVPASAARAVRDALVADPDFAADLVEAIQALPTPETGPRPM